MRQAKATMNCGGARRWRGVTATMGETGRRLPALGLTVLWLAMAGGASVMAQEGTPAVGTELGECTVAPRSMDELRVLFREAAATPIPADDASPTPAAAPTGEPADEETVAAVTATWREYLACLSAGDQARMFALSSDAMVRRQFFIDRAFGVTEEALFSFLAGTPVPVASDQEVPFVPFTDVRVLADGRVAVIGPGEGGRGDVRIFVQEDGRWLLDDWFDLS